MTPTTLDCHWLLPEPGRRPTLAAQRLHLAGGRLHQLEALDTPPTGPRRAVLPALSNAHDHGRFFRSATVGAYGQPLESWLPFLGIIPGADPYLNAAATFARAARHGIANLMVHYTRVQGGMPYVDEVAQVARAARDVGIRIALAVNLRDRHGIGYCADELALSALRPGIRGAVAQRLSVKPVSPQEQLDLVDAVGARLAEDGLLDHVTLQYGPAGVQWCSPALLAAVARASAENGRPVHMHLLETQYQRAWADQAHPQGLVKYLDEIGLLSPRLTLAHAVWTRPEDWALLAERGVTVAINTSSNLVLKSGIAPVAGMLQAGVRLALGLDAAGLDEDDDPLRELRLAYHLHRGWGYEETLARDQLWPFAAQHGRRSVLGGDHPQVDGGVLQAGTPADLVVLDWDALDNDGLLPVEPEDLLLARGSARHVRGLVVGGRQVVEDGQVLGLDEAELRGELVAQMRHRIAADPAVAEWQQTVQALAEDLGPFYQRSAWRGCC